MKPEHEELLSDVFCDVTEKMAFMFGERVDTDEFPPSGPGHVRAAMTFSGPLKGRLALAVPMSLCPEIAANVLGMELDDPRASESAGDALKELLNVTCGHLLTGLAGDDPVFDLSVPEVSKLSQEQWEAMQEDDGALAFLVDDTPVLLSMQLTQE